jgi:hypothetical protein
MTARGFPPLGEDWKRWAHTFTAYMGRAMSQLAFKYSGSVAAEDGVLLWDAENGYPSLVRMACGGKSLWLTDMRC